MTQLYLNKLLSTSSEPTLQLHLLLLMPQNIGHFVNSPYGTENKKYLKQSTVIEKFHNLMSDTIPQIQEAESARKAI